MILCWPMFPATSLVKLAAASIPFLGTAQFVLVGSGLVKDAAFVKGIGHEPGQERMLLRGPVQYGICSTVLTMAAFRTPLSVIPICVLCAGDAAAALYGYYKGKNKLPWNESKVRPKHNMPASWAATVALTHQPCTSLILCVPMVCEGVEEVHVNLCHELHHGMQRQHDFVPACRRSKEWQLLL